MPIPDFVRDDLTRLDLVLSDEQLARLDFYLTHLLETNQHMNLTAVRESEAAWRRLIIDSLTILPWMASIPADARVIDVGSGGGMPGIPLAIARPDLGVTLLEATGKKAKFLESCVAKVPLPNVKVLASRAETAGQDKAHRQQYDVAVCRAVGPLRELLEYTLPLVKVGGVLLAMKGPSLEKELEDASDALHRLGAGEVQVFDAYPPGFEINTVVVQVTKQHQTHKQYPRAPGVPRMEPL